MSKKHKIWIIIYFVLVFGALAFIGGLTYKVDPFIHFHKPDTSKYFYKLENQRSLNYGIINHFDYSGLITGTSMAENFKTSEADTIFDCSFIKVCSSGATFKETNDYLESALACNDDLRIIIRGLDMGMFFDDSERMREDLGEYPTYLYDDNVFNDVKYLYNGDVLFSHVYPMIKEKNEDSFTPGITSFDEYSNWTGTWVFGKNTLYPDGVTVRETPANQEITEEEKDTIIENIRLNVTDIADEYPNVKFYYFFTPYSIQWWQSQKDCGLLYKQIEAERVIIEEILKYDNIKLFSFNCLSEITTDLNNYKDNIHYGEWVNSLLLKYMSEDKYLLTYENYESYLTEERELYYNYDYAQLNAQEDYINDKYVVALYNEKINGVEPLHIDLRDNGLVAIQNAEIVEDQYNGANGILCTGCIQRPSESEISVSDYLRDTEYIGFKYSVDDISKYKYLVFYGKKISDHGQLGVYVYDNNGNELTECTQRYNDLDNEWHQYLIDISQFGGGATIIFNGGYIDNSGNADSQYVFSDITLY